MSNHPLYLPPKIIYTTTWSQSQTLPRRESYTAVCLLGSCQDRFTALILPRMSPLVMPSAKRSHAGALFDDMFDLEAQLSDSAVAIDDSPAPPKRQRSQYVLF
jgi:hypothetical protein